MVKVRLLQNAKILGTQMVFQAGDICNAFQATNQPNYIEEKLYFLEHQSGDTALFSVDGVECEFIPQEN